MAKDVVVIDEVIISISKSIYKESKIFDKTLREYINILKEIEESGFIAGETHEAVSVFLHTIEKFEKLTTKAGKIIYTQTKICLDSLDTYSEGLY